MTTELPLVTETLKARVLRYLMANQTQRFTGAALAAILDAKRSSVNYVLAAGYESCMDGWENVHRTTNSRPVEYWASTVERQIALEVVGDDTMVVVGNVGAKLVCRRDRDRSIWIAYPMTDGDA